LVVQAADQVFIPNNLPYIVKFEEGHSMQAPAGMVALPSEEVNLHMNKLIRAGLKDAGLQGGLDGGGDPSSLSKEKGQYGAGGDDNSQHPQGFEERAHFLHGRHPPHVKDSREMTIRKAGILPSNLLTRDVHARAKRWRERLPAVLGFVHTSCSLEVQARWHQS
jgi:hypothetical protein